MTADRTYVTGLNPGDVIEVLGGIERVVAMVRRYRLVTIVVTTDGATYRYAPTDIVSRMAS